MARSRVFTPSELLGERKQLLRQIVTPEGVPIDFQLASAGDRASAFLVDMVVQMIALSVIGFILNLTGARGESLKAILVIAEFLLVNFYFAFFEIRWQGQTPGKKVIGIRVIDSRGGQLETNAVLARNLTRELEVWTPVRFLILNRFLWPDAPSWALLVAGAWTFIFLFLPSFNKDKLRVGDLVGGTRVVVQPKTVLVPDLVTQAAESMQMKAQVRPNYTFTDEQLAIYGIYELQVLEGVLRQDPNTLGYYDAVGTVCDKIRAKIDYKGRIDDSTRFLKDFYVALRAQLEQKMLFGQRKADKYAKPGKK